MHKKLSALMLAFLLTAALSGCVGKGDTITQDELPYGATIALHKDDGILPSQYDYRFITDDMRDAVLRYYYAIQSKNTDLFIDLQHPLWHDYELNTVYAGQFTDEQLLASTYDALALDFGGDFEFSFIDIAEAALCEEGSDGRRIGEMLVSLAEEQGDKDFAKNLGEIWELSVTRYLAKQGSGVHGETNHVLYDEALYLLQYQNDWYIIYT